MMQDRVGQQLGNYRLTQLLGHGGYAHVYLAEHIYLRTQAAIKVLHVDLDESERNPFLDEARTIARLIHPHIIRILDYGIEPSSNTPYLVMDYAPNGTLRHRHPKGTHLSLDTIVSYVKQIASALHYAHSQNVIHRDVKPGNMLLGQDGHVFLSDFGIATIAHNTASQSTDETVIGTIAYMAPEQIQGKARPASDQYALGIVVYEWLCGERPFHGSFTEIVAQQMSAEPPPLRDTLPGVSQDVEEVIRIALAKDPKERFASVETFAHALEQAAAVSQQGNNTATQPVPLSSPVAASSQSTITQSPVTQTPSTRQSPSATVRPVQQRPRLSHGSQTPSITQAQTQVPVAASPPMPIDTSTESHEGPSSQRRAFPAERRRRSRILGLGASQFVGMLFGLILVGGLVVLMGHSTLLPQVVLAGLSTLALISLLTTIVLISTAAVSGPIAGLLIGIAGFFLADLINLYTLQNYALHPFSSYLLSGLFGLLAGLFAGAALGRYKLVRAVSLIVVDILGAIAVIVGVPLTIVSVQNFLQLLVALAISLVLVPLLIQNYKAIAGHR